MATTTKTTTEATDLAQKIRAQALSSVKQGQQMSIDAAQTWVTALSALPVAGRPEVPGLPAVPDLKAPVLGLYGGQDSGIPLSTVNQMKDALAQAAAKGNKAAGGSEFVVYKDAPHAFHADYRPSYRKAAAEDGFARALAWFKSQGVT